MVPRSFLRYAVGLIALGLGLCGCESTLAPTRAVLLPISEIDAPASVAPGETILVRLTVVFGGCRSFERMETTRSASRVTYKARGLDRTGPDVLCTGDIRTEIVESRIEPPLTDPVTLVAVQPDADETTRTVRVSTR